MPNLVVHEQLAEFEARVKPFLMRREAEHNLLLGLLTVMKSRPQPPAWFMGQVKTLGRTNLVGFYSGRLLVLSEGAVAGLAALAHGLGNAGIDLPGVVGPPALVESFLDCWTDYRDVKVRRRVDQRIYVVRAVNFPSAVGGKPMMASSGDLDLALEWLMAFYDEATPEAPQDPAAARVLLREKIEAKCLFLWEHGGVKTSLVGIGRPTPNGFSVGPVYTPPAHRNLGYATALVAVASQAILEMGKRFAVLYTDLSNPTSNSIYQKIGYRPVCDSLNLWFEGR